MSAPPHIDNPGNNNTAPKIDPIIDPSTNFPFAWLRATQYKKISTIVEKKALITAPTPIDDCAEIDATAWPMKYANGMIENNDKQKIKLDSVIQESQCMVSFRK